MSHAVLKIYNFIYFLDTHKVPFIPEILNKILVRILFGCQIGLGAKFGKNCILGYGGLGIVIHERCSIGDNVTIGTNVTIGGTSGKYGVPVIGDNCIISTGSKILGPITIGNNCIIGANAVLLDDLPSNCLAVGVPAKIIKRDIDVNDYK